MRFMGTFLSIGRAKKQFIASILLTYSDCTDLSGIIMFSLTGSSTIHNLTNRNLVISYISYEFFIGRQQINRLAFSLLLLFFGFTLILQNSSQTEHNYSWLGWNEGLTGDQSARFITKSCTVQFLIQLDVHRAENNSLHNTNSLQSTTTTVIHSSQSAGQSYITLT
jgi:hypothetical protein